MTTEKESTENYKEIIDRLQEDVEGLKTKLLFLTDASFELIKTELKATKAELEKTQESLESVQKEFIGSIMAFATETPPDGWIECNGQAVSRATYARLFQKIGIIFGNGDGSATFNLPDLRGVFVRGLDKGRKLDAKRKLGSYQDDYMQSHTHKDLGHSHGGSVSSDGTHKHNGKSDTDGNHSHSGNTDINGEHTHEFDGHGNNPYDVPNHKRESSKSSGNLYTKKSGIHSHFFLTNSAGSHYHNLTIDSAGSHSHSLSVNTGSATISNPTDCRHGNETRPKNVALLFCVKY